MHDTNVNYDAPPTVAAFMKDENFGRIIAGPVGSGKTTGCIFELLRRACAQEPASDGLRYTRFAIVRQTLKQLKDTVLKDIVSWLKGIAEYKVSDNTIYIKMGSVRSEWLLIPLDNPEDQRRLLSAQLTGAWMSEAIEMDPALVPALSGRCGRYPSAGMGGATWFGIIADTNMPSEGSGWYKIMETEVPQDWGVFKQPGGLDETAENLEWLTQTSETLRLTPDDPRRRAQGRLYYERLARSNSPDWIKRYVHAQYGDDPSGSAVFRESFKMKLHVVDNVEPVIGHPLLIGQDFGRDPCAVICQLDHKGRLLVLDEIISEDMGLELHLSRKDALGLRPKLMQDRFVGRPVALVGDPAGMSRDSIYEENSFDVLKRHGFTAVPAPTNDIDSRIRAVEAYLLQRIGDQPAFLVDRNRCPTVVRALSGGYRFAKTRSGILRPKPEKNNYSHPMDALQYAALAAHGGMVKTINSRFFRPRVRERKVFTSRAWT
jgi:hypothetical protein